MRNSCGVKGGRVGSSSGSDTEAEPEAGAGLSSAGRGSAGSGAGASAAVSGGIVRRQIRVASSNDEIRLRKVAISLRAVSPWVLVECGLYDTWQMILSAFHSNEERRRQKVRPFVSRYKLLKG